MRDLNTPPQSISAEQYYSDQIAHLNKQLYDAYLKIKQQQEEIQRLKNGQN